MQQGGVVSNMYKIENFWIKINIYKKLHLTTFFIQFIIYNNLLQFIYIFVIFFNKLILQKFFIIIKFATVNQFILRLAKDTIILFYIFFIQIENYERPHVRI